ncbi:hypothetical protein Bca52824_046975 [Brassica carinata]|uniref:non-specific serine/threonine protein kinase n=3 Tax=Brassica TaxID=3705 RepID=A0A0D3BZ96_BRAOL|nr:hypothetical protein Bca52824_046975 [Brassica carinata]VDD11000.1 unnamed protein product [Brassica oleracea]
MLKVPDSSSPTGVLEEFFRTEEFESSEAAKNPSSSRFRRIVELLRSTSKKSLENLKIPFHNNAIKSSLRRCTSLRDNLRFGSSNDAHFLVHSPRRIFTFSELKIATNNFAFENLIGKGGYAEVYKGRLSNGQMVAIKRLMRGNSEEIIGDFLSEMGIMAHVNHSNIAKLLGYGVEGGMHLVLELSPHGSLASMLYSKLSSSITLACMPLLIITQIREHCLIDIGSKEKMNWSIRYKIALGVAEGLVYLHRGCHRRIIHRDIKAANILLTHDFSPQICDFGLAKWLPEHWTHHIVSKFEGTFGYLAPEYLTHGIVDEKTDVFALGVLLLELVTGRRALDYSKQSLVLWAKPLMKKNKIRELIDPSLVGDYDWRQIKLVLLAASLSIQQSSIERPGMSQVVEILKGNLNDLKCIMKCKVPFYRKAFRDEHIKGYS